jgi:hypothetical protein
MTLKVSMRSLLVMGAVVLGCGGSSVVKAASGCQPLQIAGPSNRTLAPVAAPSGEVRIHVEPALIDDGLHLLGVDGSRIKVDSDLLPLPRWLAGGMRLPASWADRVDWRAYDQDALSVEPGVTMVFAPDAQGRPHLCRIEQRRLTPAYWARATKHLTPEQNLALERLHKADPLPEWLAPRRASDLALVEVQQLVYDNQWRARGEESLQWDEEAAHWSRTVKRCVCYEPGGAVASVSQPAAGPCQEAPVADVTARYVHGPDGILQRSIEIVTQTELQRDGYKDVKHPMVSVYAASGTPEARYREDALLRHFRLPDAALLSKGNDPPVAVVQSSATLAKLTIRNPDAYANAPWRVYALPKDADSLYDPMAVKSTVLAQGKMSKFGNIQLSVEEQQRVWRAMNDGHSIVVLDALGAMLLAPAVAAAQWQACIDPKVTGVDACP